VKVWSARAKSKKWEGKAILKEDRDQNQKETKLRKRRKERGMNNI
jgi:hypothetical protein